MRAGCWRYCSNDRCAVHGADRAQRGLIESLPRPHTRSLPPGRQCRNDYSDHSLPQVSASEHTHDHSHASHIAAWAGSALSAFKRLGRRDHVPTRPCPVDDASGLSAMLMAQVRVGVDDRSAIKARSGADREAAYATREPCAGRWVGWSQLRTSHRLRPCRRVRSSDNRVELRRPAT
jgi:hypothetical protein